MKPTEKKTNSKDYSTEKDFYIGESIDSADKNKVDPELVKERTQTLNDNPRDNSLDE
ncbi:MAG: hypothetical protein K2K88_03570 [Muribaculaceae bacterium]|nr:hypothetical protein [Muribaculaceae bacterium]MDE6352207.1 hypothetical protein [Muribaculaceae bacterium]MDE6643691.1 hypothetical protein [Muribaculaceae bacterium]